jgi:hypothetical protein
MSHLSKTLALLFLTGGSAWAAGGVGGAAGAVSSGTPTPPAATTTGVAATTGNSGLVNTPVSTNANPLPPPPPSSLNPTTSSNNTVPPTPAPATAGLPSTPNSPALSSQQGLSATAANESRPSPSLDVAQVVNVQAALAAGGLYRGPIDGNMNASVRASIREFQQISALPQTGELDAQTLATLSHSSVAGAAGSNGTTSTAGNRSASEPFATTFTGVPATPTSSTPGGPPVIFSTPFQLSAPINTSPATPPALLIQP